MKGKYLIAAGLALAGVAIYFFTRKTKRQSRPQTGKENERHHLTNAFAKAKQTAVRR